MKVIHPFSMLALFVLALSAGVAQSSEKDTIPYKVIDKQHLGREKLSLDIIVEPVGNRLPNESELRAISVKEVRKDGIKYARAFVSFYLPGMQVGAGAFATAHHNPKLKILIQEYVLVNYPQYHKYLSKELRDALSR